ncbi:CD276 antigen homolog [Fundulus diaphanus]
MQSLTRAVARMSLLLCLQSVSCQIQGFVKKAVLLPCIYTDSKLTNANVFWRDTSDKNVLDIQSGKEDFSTQNEKYKDRVSSFPEEYSRGNFSITLKNLQQQDSGVYDCFIYSADTHRAVSLTVSAEPTVGPTTPAPRGAAAKICAHLLLLAAPFLTCFL